ncbi:MAG: AMP-binding protein [Thermoleophilia bacterium]
MPVALREGDADGTIPARLDHVAQAVPDAPALDDGADALTYAELAGRVHGVAWSVTEHGCAPGEPVALLLRQGAAAVAAALGVLAAGGACAPLDPDDPPAHLATLCERLRVRLVLADRGSASAARALATADRAVVIVDEPVRVERSAPPARGAPDGLAYVHFTSGSTGRPKGVMDSHRTVLDNILRYTRTLAIDPRDRLTALQPPAFSGVVSSTLGALLNGATLLPMRASDGVAALAAAVRGRGATIYHSVPSILRSMVAVDGGLFPGVRVVRLEGDRATAADAALARRHFPAAVIANGLGTSETGLCRQLRIGPGDPLPADGPLPVGHRVPGVDAVVLDPRGSPAPAGDAGEIVVIGRHLALGYWEEPGLTAAAFSPDPADPARRRYRTGDLGRMQPDGCLEYLGRLDGGLKVGGRRVEPAEVEGHLLAIPGVREAVVATRPGRRGEGVLTARVVLAPGAPGPAELRAALRERLPAAMVPAEILPVGRVALTAAGKLDRAAVVIDGRRTPVPPRDADEERLVAIWRTVLERGDIGVHDDFAALGGDSLAAAELLAALEDEGWRGADAALVRARTVAELARELRGEGPAAPGAGIAMLRAGGPEAPVVLAHGSHIGLAHYAALVPHLPGDRPVWGLEPPADGGATVRELAAAHAAALRTAAPGGPGLVAGFCSGAILAAEVARALRAAGGAAPHALVGIDAGDIPGLVPRSGLARHRASRRPVARLRRHLALSRAERALATRVFVRDLRARPGDGPFGPGFHRPDRIPGPVLLVLSEEQTARWTDAPARDWSGLADAVDVRMVGASNGDLVREPAVGEVARLLGAAAGAQRASG